MLKIDTPTTVRLIGFDDRLDSVQNVLTYVNKAKQFELRRMEKSRWYVNQHGEEAWRAEIDRLKSEVKVCLLKTNGKDYYTYSGLAGLLHDTFGDPIVNAVQYPDPGNVPYAKMPTGEDRYYQTKAAENLLAVKHGAVEIGTGLGKSRIIRNLAHALGLKTLVVAPSVSIARQLYRDFLHHFGNKRVGLYGDGKKESGKQFVVGLFQSLTRITPGSKEWDDLRATKVFIVDESHLTPASTLKSVCDGLAATAPYRFFFSGTQMRNDGADLLLEGIIGPVVYTMTVEQGVDEGFLSKPNFTMVEMVSPSNYISSDPDYMLDRHFYSNKALYQRAAEIANKSVSALGHQVLILIEEVTQFQHLWPHLKHVTEFAHGGVTKTNKGSVPPQFHKSDPEALVDALNAGKLPILVGTSCISIGTDIQTPKTIINLQAGVSEVKIRQAVGRGTRRTVDKNQFNYWDFCVKSADPNIQLITERHARMRYGIYRDIYPNVRIVE
jgi:superfamily II DNA or RNA helicase